MKRIVFDLDDTICFPNHSKTTTFEKYALAIPSIPVIEGIVKLKSQGYYIIIHSARRMLTHNGNLEAILKDVQQVTVDWLERHGVPYDELIFGKPYADTYYVDDKAMTIESFLKWTSST